MKQIQKTPDHGMSKLSPIGAKYFKFIEFDPDEELLIEVRKHWFGMFLIFLAGFFVGGSVLLASFALASGNFLSSVGADSMRPFVALGGFLFTVVVIALTLVFAYLYQSNVVFVTNEKIAQVLYLSIFNRKISQLNIGDVQDVTVKQNGFFAHVFHYGTLVVETAGEQQNYTFNYVPEPHNVARTIITSHEANLKQYGN